MRRSEPNEKRSARRATRVFDVVATWTAYPFLFSLLTVMSEYRRLQSLGKRPNVHFEAEYQGQKIVVFALFQKGRLRRDTIGFLQTLKAAGHYVLCVNTLKLSDPEAMREHCDCYIERFNFGRDFGSYQEGFRHIYRRGWERDCPRLMMVNDSVYCVSDRAGAFVADMMDAEAEVLGSTENYEIIHHLGSFCIALAGRVVREKVFRDFWKSYRQTDVRPVVIKKGEQRFSKMLRRAVSAVSEFQALYGTHAFLERLQDSDAFIDDAIRNARVSPLTGWKRFSVREVIDDLRKKYLIETFDPAELEVAVEVTGADVSDRVFVGTFDGIVKVAEANLRAPGTLDRGVVKDVVISQLTEVYMSGSQIHQNASTLLSMGLPIVKMDGLYRGMFTIQDLQMIAQQLVRKDALELQDLLLDRPYGGDALRGWRRAAFMRGLI